MNVNVIFLLLYNSYQKLGALNLMAFKSRESTIPLRVSKMSTCVWKTHYTYFGNRSKVLNLEEKDRDTEENRKEEK